MSEDMAEAMNASVEEMDNEQAAEGSLYAREEQTGFAEAGTSIGAQSSRDLLLDIELDATLQFGSREMSLKDVLSLGPGDVVELDRHVSEPVDLVVGDRIVARGEVVVVSGNFAFLVNEVAAPQMRLESIRCLF